MSYRCWTEISKEQILKNYMIYKSTLPIDKRIMAVVKADAYGHGDVEVASLLEGYGVQDFAVATLEEAVKLRKHGIGGEILVLGYVPIDEVDLVLEYDVTLTILSEEYDEALSQTNKKVKVQFAIDTGMNRIGLNADDPERCEAVIRKRSSDFCLTGIFTHLCRADTFDESAVNFTRTQIEKFERICNRIMDMNLPYIHCLNSAGGLWHKANVYSFVRLGIVLYGLKPDVSNTLPNGIAPVLEWKSRVAMVKFVKKGSIIGYGGTYKAEKNMLVATITTGYADGYSRRLSNCGEVIIRGRRAQIVGSICMDQFMVDVTNNPTVTHGDTVTLVGHDGDEFISADELASMGGTIGYELVCAISTRVTRTYK